jgi:CRP-like cAMP-binding protein
LLDMPTHPLTSMISKLADHTALSGQDFAALAGLPHSVCLYGQGSSLVRAGSSFDDCSVLISGFAFSYKINSQGLRQIVSIHHPGDIVGFRQINVGTADCNVQTLTRCEVATIRQSRLRGLATSRNAIGNALIASTLIDVSIYREWIMNIGRRNARTRVAHLLCEFAARLDAQGAAPGQPYKLPMSQAQLGDALGLTAVHVNRTIKGLVKDGLVTQDNRVITFPAWDILRVEADFNSDYLKLADQTATSSYS